MTLHSEWNEHIDALCAHVANSGTARSYCTLHGLDYANMHSTFDRHPVLRERYEAAREMRLAALEDDLQDLADTEPRNGTDVLWRRLQIETRAKILQARRPDVWGAKQQLDHHGDLQVQILTSVPQPDAETGEDLLR